MKAELKFVFMMCNDVAAIVDFYGDTLGCATKSNLEQGWALVNAGVDIAFFKGDYPLPEHKEWAWQPGYNGGTANINSYSISTDEKNLRAIFERAKMKNVKMISEKPVWRKDSYWAITIMDPMGTTIEIYSEVPKPLSTEWK